MDVVECLPTQGDPAEDDVVLCQFIHVDDDEESKDVAFLAENTDWFADPHSNPYELDHSYKDTSHPHRVTFFHQSESDEPEYDYDQSHQATHMLLTHPVTGLQRIRSLLPSDRADIAMKEDEKDETTEFVNAMTDVVSDKKNTLVRRSHYPHASLHPIVNIPLTNSVTPSLHYDHTRGGDPLFPRSSCSFTRFFNSYSAAVDKSFQTLDSKPGFSTPWFNKEHWSIT